MLISRTPVRENEDKALPKLLSTGSSGFLTLTPEETLIWWSTGVIFESMVQILTPGA